MRRRSQDELFEHDADDEEQGIQQLNRRIQLDALFQAKFWLDRNEEMLELSTSLLT